MRDETGTVASFMSLKERMLYHQIHPLKLFVDVATAVAAVFAMWEHRILESLLVGFVPSVLVSLVMIRYLNLGPQKDSAFGRYVARCLTDRWTDNLRLGGFGVMLLAGWYQSVIGIVLGSLVVIGVWMNGLIRQSS